MDIDKMVSDILSSYEEYGGANLMGRNIFPNRENVISVLHDLQSLIFPGYRTAEFLDKQTLRYVTGERVHRIIHTLTHEIQKSFLYVKCDDSNPIKFRDVQMSHCFSLAEKTAASLICDVPELRRMIRLDAQAAFEGDPAAKSTEEVIVSYPGLEAISVYRIAHNLHVKGVPVIPRIMSEHAHGKTGIDIHPGATIGESFFIDHGTGVVIGETAVIGEHVKIYQGVTLGALSTRAGQKLKGIKRHPTIEDYVTIYAGASILGGETVIGKNAVIGSNAFITTSIAPGAKVSIKNQELDIKTGKKTEVEQKEDWFYII